MSEPGPVPAVNGPEDDLVVVPRVSGPLIPMARPSKGRDELDDLIDELLPDSDEPPGWFDAALLASGLALVGWAVVGHAPNVVLIVGIGVLALGLVLPARSLWRRAAARREARRRADLGAQGVPLRTSDQVVARLTAAYRDLLASSIASVSGIGSGPEIDASGTAVAHAAVLEVATLLQGRAPTTAKERAYVERRAIAIEELVQARRERGRPRSGAGEHRCGAEGDALVDARDELDAVAGTSTVDELRAEVRRLDGDG